jgi:hypothetical protein
MSFTRRLRVLRARPHTSTRSGPRLRRGAATRRCDRRQRQTLVTSPSGQQLSRASSTAGWLPTWYHRDAEPRETTAVTANSPVQTVGSTRTALPRRAGTATTTTAPPAGCATSPRSPRMDDVLPSLRRRGGHGDHWGRAHRHLCRPGRSGHLEGPLAVSARTCETRQRQLRRHPAFVDFSSVPKRHEEYDVLDGVDDAVVTSANAKTLAVLQRPGCRWAWVLREQADHSLDATSTRTTS